MKVALQLRRQDVFIFPTLVINDRCSEEVQRKKRNITVFCFMILLFVCSCVDKMCIAGLTSFSLGSDGNKDGLLSLWTRRCQCGKMRIDPSNV